MGRPHGRRVANHQAAALIPGLPTLRALRTAAGLTLAQLAGPLGITAAAAHHIETGRNGISAVQWMVWLNECGWSVAATRSVTARPGCDDDDVTPSVATVATP